MKLNQKIDTHPRQWNAAFFSLLWPGIGQLYNGQAIKSLIILAAFNFWQTLFFGYLYLNLISDKPENIRALIILFWGIAYIAHLWTIADAALHAERADARTLVWYRKWYFSLAILLILVMVGHPLRRAIRNHLIRPVQVVSSSMSPTVLTGDRLFCNQIYYDRNPPRRGDIISIRTHGNAMDVVKRIIGLPGDTLAIREGRVYINSIELHEPVELIPDTTPSFGPVKLHSNQFFVLGDNRPDSFDSRYFGPIQRHQMNGRPMFVYWSWDTEIPSRQIWKRLASIRWNRIGHMIQ